MSLIAAYRFDDISGVSQSDQLGAGPVLAHSGPVISGTGVLSGGITGTGGAALKNGGISALGPLRSGNWTVAFWVKRTSSSYGWTMEWMKQSTTDGFIAGNGNVSGQYGAVQYSNGGGFVDASPAATPTLNTWMFYAYTWDLSAKRLRGYTNAVQHSVATDAGASLPADFDRLAITLDLAVIIDQMMFYDEILTPTTGTNSLNQLYNSGAGYDPTNIPEEAAPQAGGFASRFSTGNKRFVPWVR
jgi:hypothetical protein